MLMFDKFEGTDFKYDNKFLKFLPKNTQIWNKTFLIPNLDIFVFLQDFANWQIWVCWFQIW